MSTDYPHPKSYLSSCREQQAIPQAGMVLPVGIDNPIPFAAPGRRAASMEADKADRDLSTNNMVRLFFIGYVEM
jgi:hypothetical protein